jgi:hypothetical protein
LPSKLDRRVPSGGPPRASYFGVTAADPVTGVKVSFPDLNHDAGFGGEDFQTNLIMPEPTIFLSKDLPCMFDRTPNSNKAEPRLELLSSSLLWDSSSANRRSSSRSWLMLPRMLMRLDGKETSDTKGVQF